jgi:coenzyme F420 biosynthesis associated uncharacterized protein
MVDWGVARQIARFAARTDEVPDLGLDLAALARELEPHVVAHTGLEPVEPVPPAETVSRPQWAEANLDTLADLLAPVTDRLEDRLSSTGPLAGALRAGAGVTLAAEVGLVTGYLSQHVVGQYELSLLAAQPAPRLLLVAPNLAEASHTLGVDRESFLRWVTIHELVHALQFGGVPWLRPHLGGLLREYMDTVEVKISGGAGAFGRPALPNPADLVARVREGGLPALVQTREQRDLLDRLQVVMAVIEGHAEHVMDALAPELVPEHQGLRAAMDHRRASRSAPQRVLMRLLGMEMKMRQYREGKAFCDAVAQRGGPALLRRVWDAPEALPDAAELADPARWIARGTAAAA